MVQPIFVAALHCTPDGIGIFVGFLRPKKQGEKEWKKKEKRNDKHIPQNKDSFAFHSEICVLCSKQENTWRNLSYVMEGYF